MADGLDLQLLERFNTQLDVTYTKLIQLDEELTKFKKLSVVDVKTGPGLRATARALDQLSQAISRFSKISVQNTKNVGEVILTTIRQFDSAARLIEGSDLGRLPQFLKQMAASIRSIAAIQKLASGAASQGSSDFLTKVVRPLFGSINQILEQASFLTPGRLTGLSASLNAITGVLREVIKVAKEVQQLSSDTLDPKLFKALAPFINAVLTLLKATETITPARLANAAVAFKNVGTLFKTIGNTVSSLAPLKGASPLAQFFKLDPTSQFIKLISMIRSLFYFAQELTPERLANLGKTFQGIGLMFRSLSSVVGLIGTLTGRFGNLIKLAYDLYLFDQITKPIIKLTRSLSEAAKTDAGAAVITNFGSFIRGLLDITDLLDRLGSQFQGIGGFFKLADQLWSLERIAGRLRNIIVAFAGIDVKPGVFEGSELLIKSLTRITKQLLDTQFRFNPTQFLRSAFLLERIAGRLKNIFKSFANVDVKPGVFDGLDSAVRALIPFLRQLILLDIDSSQLKNVGKSLKIVEDVGKRLGKIFENIGKGFKNIDPKGLLSALNVIPKLALIGKDFEYNEQFFKFIRELGDSLKYLRIEERVGQSLKDIGQILTALEKLDAVQDKLAQLKNNTQANGTASIRLFGRLKDVISKAVTEGILRATLLLKIFDTLKQVVLTLGKAFLKFVFPPSVVAANLSSLKKIGDAIREIGDNIRDVGEQMRDTGQQLFSNFGITKLFESAAVQSAVGFDQLSTQVQTFGNLSDEATSQAEALAFEIGQKFPLSANEALSAILDLIKAGQDLGAIEFVLPAASNLAALSETGDLDRVISTLIAAEGAFDTFAVGVEGTFDNIAIATDIIASGANVSTASVESLGEGLANVGTAANAFGLSLEETVAVLAIFEDAGLKAAEGGTALRSLLNALDRPQTATALKNLGVALFDPETGTRRPLNDIINDINTALDGMPEAQRVAVLQQLSDTFGRQGLNILLGEGADGIANVVEEMNALPTAAEQAAQLLDNLSGDLQQLQGSVETFLLRAALPMIDRFFRPFVQLGRLVVDSILTLDESFFEFLGTATALSSILVTLVAGFLVFTGTVLQVGGVVFTVVGTLLNLQLVLGGLIAFSAAFVTGLLAITAALVIFIPLITAVTGIFETFYQIFTTNAGNASTAAQAFFGTLRSTIQTVAGFVSSFLTLLNTFVFQTGSAESRFDDLGAAVASFFGNLSSFFTGGFIGNARIVLGQLTQIFDAFSLFKNTQKEIAGLSLGFGELSGVFTSAEDLATRRGLEDRLDELRAKLKTIFTDLIQNVPLFRDAIQNLFGDTSDASVQAFVDRIFTTLDSIRSGFEGITTAFSTFIGNIGKLDIGSNFRLLLTNLDEGFLQLVLGFVGLFEDFFGGNQLTEAIKIGALEGSEGVGRALVGLVIDSIQNAIVSNRDVLKDLFLGLVDGFFGLLKNLRFITDLLGAGPISDLFESFQDVLRGLLGGVFDTLVNLIAGQDLKTALLNAFGDSITPLFDFVDTLGNIFSSVQKIFTNVINFFTSGSGLGDLGNLFNFDALINGISGFVDAFSGFLDLVSLGDTGAILTNFQTFFSDLFTNASSFITTILPNIQTFLSEFLSGLGTAFKDYLISIGVPPEFIAFGESVLRTVGTAIGDAFSSTSKNLGDFVADPGAFFQRLVTQLKTFIEKDGPALFASLGTQIRDTIFASINTALSTLEDALNIDFQPAIDTITTSFNNLLTALEDLLNSTAPEGGTSLLQGIIDIINALANAIKGLFDAIPEASDEPNKPLQFIVDFAADIVALGIDTVTDFVNAINDLFDFLKTADPEAIAALGVAIGSVLLLFAGPALAAGVTALVAAFASLATTVFTVVLPFLALFIIIRALIKNVDELLQVFTELGEGDFKGAGEQLGDALLNIFADITDQFTDLINLFLGLFGIAPIEFDRDATVELGRELYRAFEDASGALEITFDRIIADLGANFSIWAKEIRDSVLGVTDVTAIRARAFFDEQSFSLQGLTDVAANTNDKDYVEALAVVNQEEISDQIRAEIGKSLEEGDPYPVTASDIIALRDLGVLSRTLEDAIFGGDLGVAEALIESSALTPEEISKIADNIKYAVEQGFITAEDALVLLQNIEIDPATATQLGIDPAAQQAILDATEAEIQAGIDGAEPVIAEVPVETELLVGSEEAAAAAAAASEQAANSAQEELNRQAAVPIYVPYTVELVPATGEGESAAPVGGDTAFQEDTLNLAGADAEDVAALSEDLSTLQTRAQLVKIDLDALLPTLQQLGIDLGTTQTAFDNNTASMVAYVAQLGLINTGYRSLLLNMLLANIGLLTMSLNFANFGIQANIVLNQVNAAVAVFRNQLLVMMTTFIQGFVLVEAAANRLALTLGRVVAKAQELAKVVADTTANAESAAGGGGGGDDSSGDDGQRAHGGKVTGENKRRGYGKYQIGEGGSEVLFENGKMYLLTRGEGQIATLSNGLPQLRNDASTGLYPTSSSQNVVPSNNVSNVNVEGANISVTISGASGDPNAIAQEVVRQIEQQQQSQTNDVRRRLRANHKG